MAETDYFKQMRAASLNHLTTQASSWIVDAKYIK